MGWGYLVTLNALGGILIVLLHSYDCLMGMFLGVFLAGEQEKKVYHGNANTSEGTPGVSERPNAAGLWIAAPSPSGQCITCHACYALHNFKTN
jgi:hypothetical protein